MSNDQMTNILTIILFIMIGVLAFLSVIYIILKVRENKKQHPKEKDMIAGSKAAASEKAQVEYSKKSIFSFMKFDKIEDDMIVRKNGTKFLMVVECQGINYDLMSGIEKNSIEQGFLQFLNTLKHPIQIYTQTRTINLDSSIQTYKEKIKEVQYALEKQEMQYNQMVRSEAYTQEQLNKAYFELTKQKNLYEYGKDIIFNTLKKTLLYYHILYARRN